MCFQTHLRKVCDEDNEITCGAFMASNTQSNNHSTNQEAESLKTVISDLQEVYPVN